MPLVRRFRRFSACLIQCFVLLGWFAAPAADAWVYHRAAPGQQWHQAHSAVDATPEHSYTGCAIILAANLPQSVAAAAPDCATAHAAHDEPVTRESSAPVFPALTRLPQSRAPPSA